MSWMNNDIDKMSMYIFCDWTNHKQGPWCLNQSSWILHDVDLLNLEKLCFICLWLFLPRVCIYVLCVTLYTNPKFSRHNLPQLYLHLLYDNSLLWIRKMFVFPLSVSAFVYISMMAFFDSVMLGCENSFCWYLPSVFM